MDLGLSDQELFEIMATHNSAEAVGSETTGAASHRNDAPGLTAEYNKEEHAVQSRPDESDDGDAGFLHISNHQKSS